MSYLVQDLLDYAQIKANQFRKNYKKFDIREAVKKVMSYQQIQAKSQKVNLISTYAGPDSSIIYHDEERIM